MSIMRVLVRLAILIGNLLVWGMIVAAICAVMSCAGNRPIVTHKVDSIYLSRYERDTVYKLDSVRVYTLRDTVYNDRYRYVYRDRLLRDTVYRGERDTITNVVEVERRISAIEELEMSIGHGVLWAVPIIVALWLLYRKFLK